MCHAAKTTKWTTPASADPKGPAERRQTEARAPGLSAAYGAIVVIFRMIDLMRRLAAQYPPMFYSDGPHPRAR
jgi:hypothetical protein